MNKARSSSNLMVYHEDSKGSAPSVLSDGGPTIQRLHSLDPHLLEGDNGSVFYEEEQAPSDIYEGVGQPPLTSSLPDSQSFLDHRRRQDSSDSLGIYSAPVDTPAEDSGSDDVFTFQRHLSPVWGRLGGLKPLTVRAAKREKNHRRKDLIQSNRSKSLTQIDCLDNCESGEDVSPVLAGGPGGQGSSCPPMVSREEQAHTEPDTSPSPCSSPSTPGIHSRQARLPHKMPSQEMFSVSFDEWDKPGNYELVPASKGILLREALMEHLERRGIEPNHINVFLDSSNTPLSLQFETFRLGGNHLHVRSKGASPQVEGLSITRANSTGSYNLFSTGAMTSASHQHHQQQQQQQQQQPLRLPASRSNSSSSKEQEKSKKTTPMSSQRASSRRNAIQSSEDLTLCGGSPDGLPGGSLLAGIDLHGPEGRKGKGRTGLVRKQGIFASFKTDVQERENKMEHLSDLLNQYSQEGVPEMRGLLTFTPPPGSPRGPQDPETETPDNPFYLEKEWSQFVHNAQELCKRTRNQQSAIWELLHTEVFYIRRLKVITELILACLCNLQSEGILNEIDTERMFSNITDIYAANSRFWTDHLLPMLNSSRRTGEPLHPSLMKDAFLKFDQHFQTYVRYCLDHQSCIHYVKDRQKDNEHFKAFVVWCETRKDCDRLKLVDLLVKPVQRLTKYSLLLKAIQKKTEDERTKADLQEMNDAVETFVCNVDATMRQKHEQERLSSIIDRIESYDPIDVSNDELERALKEHCTLDLTCPMPGCGIQQSRHLLLEGSGFKLRETSSSKVDVHCFLFTDMLLLCKGRKGDKVKVIRQPYMVDRLVVSELRDGSGLMLIYLNEYRVAVAAFILYTQEPRLWMDKIRKAQDQYREARASVVERTHLGFLRPAAEDEDEDCPSTALLVQQGRSARSSSRSSLVHSHSGSVDMSDPVSAASNTYIPPPTSSPVSQGKAVSIELGDLRNSSMSSDDGDLNRMRSSSMETRVSVTVTSPRPERRAFLLKGGGPAGLGSLSNSVGVGSLSLSVPCLGEVPLDGSILYARDGGPMTSPNSPTTIQVPIIPPPSKTLSMSRAVTPPSPLSRPLQRTAPSVSKPPLVKTKNVSGLVTHSAPPEAAARGAELESDPCNAEDEVSRRLNAKRTCRTERRYHTADSIENLKKEKDSSIHKRLSWNCGQQQTTGSFSPCGPSERLLRSKHVSPRYPSSESVYSSSGVSSTGSVHLSQGSGDYDPEVLRMMMEEEAGSDFVLLPDAPGESATDDLDAQEGEEDEEEGFYSSGCREEDKEDPGDEGRLEEKIKIDVSEVKEGISSVQIRVNGGSPLQTAVKSSKDELLRLKQFLLNSRSVEASEV